MEEYLPLRRAGWSLGQENIGGLAGNAPVILYNGALIYDFNKEERIWTCGFRQDIRNC